MSLVERLIHAAEVKLATLDPNCAEADELRARIERHAEMIGYVLVACDGCASQVLHTHHLRSGGEPE